MGEAVHPGGEATPSKGGQWATKRGRAAGDEKRGRDLNAAGLDAGHHASTRLGDHLGLGVLRANQGERGGGRGHGEMPVRTHLGCLDSE